MSILNFLHLLNRQKFTILAITLVCACAGILAGLRLGQPHLENSIFVGISIQDKFQHTSSFENLEAANQIAESIQGWIRDSSFIDQVNKTANESHNLQAKKQEKNNLIISFKSEADQSPQNYASAITKELQTRLNEYNNNSDLKITANSQPLQSNFKSSQFILYLGLSVIIGLLLGIFTAWGWEEFKKELDSHRAAKK